MELIRIAGTPIKPAQRRRVAIVHDWLVVYGGAERCLRQLIGLFPDAELFAIVDFFSDDDRARLFGKRARTSFIQTLPFARTKYRTYLPLMPLAVEQFDLSAFDMVISSSHAVAKGVLTGPDQEHICYCHTPIRYAWDLQHQYLRESGLTRGVKSAFSRLLLHYIRLWDTRTAWGVDRFIANSAYVARRILKVYGREAPFRFRRHIREIRDKMDIRVGITSRNHPAHQKRAHANNGYLREKSLLRFQTLHVMDDVPGA